MKTLKINVIDPFTGLKVKDGTPEFDRANSRWALLMERCVGDEKPRQMRQWLRSDAGRAWMCEVCANEGIEAQKALQQQLDREAARVVVVDIEDMHPVDGLKVVAKFQAAAARFKAECIEFEQFNNTNKFDVGTAIGFLERLAMSHANMKGVVIKQPGSMVC